MGWVQQLIRRLGRTDSTRRERRAAVPRRTPRLGVENLEGRDVPSWMVPASQILPAAAGTSSPTGYTPAQIRQAYGIDQIQFSSGAAGDGTGQTIAIVSAYHNANIYNDLATFSTQFGLPQAGSGFTFTVVGQTGGAPPSAPSSPIPADVQSWLSESALDVQWAHAIAPKANILLVEATTPASLYTAVNYARTVTGVSVVSMSWGEPEFSDETNNDDIFTTPSGHTPVTFVAASGDYGTPTAYPAASPNVLSVGGTTIELTTLAGGSSSLVSEQAWSFVERADIDPAAKLFAGGGGVSQFESRPTYQAGRTPSSTQRTTPDVSFAADAPGGFAYVDSTLYNAVPGAPWGAVVGTSFGTPVWAGLLAIADQGRALNSDPALDGPADTLPGLYGLSESYYRDVVSGNTGRLAGQGYDLATGLGSPKARQVVAALSENSPASASVGGDAFGTQYGSDLGASWTVVKGSFNVPSALRATVTGVPAGDVALGVYEPVVLADVSVSAAVTIPAQSGGAYHTAELFARYADAGNYYHGRLYASAGGYGVEIYRHVNGTYGLLGSYVINTTPPSSTTSGTLTFEVVGNQLRLSFGGVLYLSVVDDHLRLPGQAGVGGTAGATFDDFAVTPLLAPTDTAFTDTFSRPDTTSTPFAGPEWRVVTGQVGVSSAAGSVTTGPGVAVYAQGAAADVSVSALVRVEATTGAGGGVIARYAGPGDANYYQGYLFYQSGHFYVGILKNVGGTFTTGLGTGQVDLGGAAAAITAVLRLEAVGPLLRLYFNGTLLATATDAQLAAPGYAGVRGATGATFDNFTVAPPAQPALPASTTDAFTRSTSPTLGGSWAGTLGQVGVSGNAAVVAAGSSGAAVYAQGVAADVSVSATVAISSGGSAGVLARQTGPGDGNFYEAYASVGGNLEVGIIKKVGATYTGLTSVVFNGPYTSASGALRLDVVGSLLRLYWGGTLYREVTDNELTGAGFAGVRGTAGSTFDDFAVTTPAGLPFADAFARGNASDLGSSWTTPDGAASVAVSGNAAAIGGTVGAAVYNQGAAADVSVSAVVTLSPTSGAGGGLLARYSGPGTTNFYQAYVAYESGHYFIHMVKNVAGTYTELGTAYDLGAASGTLSGTLRFEVGGSLLRAYWNGQVRVTATDTALPGRGLVGVRGVNIGFDDFAASALTTASFADAFNRTSPSNLGDDWTTTTGSVVVSSNKAAVTGSVPGAAVYKQGVAADVSVSATLSLTPTSGLGGGLLARYSGPGDANFYQAFVIYEDGQYRLRIVKNVAGSYPALTADDADADADLGHASSNLTGTLRFEAVGSLLRAFWTDDTGTKIIYAHDTDLTGPGYVGVRGAPGVTFDDFSFSQV